MAQPSTGPGDSGQVAVPPDSGDGRDDGSRISWAAVLAKAHENIDRGPTRGVRSADRVVPYVSDLAPTRSTRA